jgi:hypothetical protein
MAASTFPSTNTPFHTSAMRLTIVVGWEGCSGLMIDFLVADSKEQDIAYAVLLPSVRWLCRVDVHDEPNGAGTQDLVWQGIDGGT